MISFSNVDGILCVKMVSSDYKEPFNNVSHFPTDIRVYDFIRNFDLKSLEQLEITYQEGYGIYVFHMKDVICGPTWRIQLKEGEKTRAIKFEKIPIICPKVRAGIKTRYNDDRGRWEKELKTGWCSA
jgi:hypothetical protein